MKKTPAIIIAVVVVLVALVAVIAMSGNKDSMDSSMDTAQNGSSSSTSSEAPEAPADAVATNVVEITDYKFLPKNIKVKVGDTVTWTNNDTVRHNVVGVDNDLPKGPLLSKGETYTYTFTKAGVYNYICTPHPYMEASVTVE